MKAFRITDYMVPSVILRNDDIASVIYEDGARFIVPDVINEYWVGIRHPNHGIIGCYQIHQMGAVLWQMHLRILPSFRKSYSKDCSYLALKWCCHNLPNLHKIVCYVPSEFGNVSRYLRSIGFVREGVLTNSYLRKGCAIDMWIYSITKQQIERLPDA